MLGSFITPLLPRLGSGTLASVAVLGNGLALGIGALGLTTSLRKHSEMPDFTILAPLRAMRAKPTAGLFGKLGSLLPKPTGRNMAIAAATVAVAYGGYKAYGGARSLAKRARSWWNGPLKLIPADGQPQVAATYRPETAVPGSEERLMSPPKYQGLIGYVTGGKFAVLGCAVRIEDWLVVPDHVISAVTGQNLELRSMDQKGALALTEYHLTTLVTVDTDLVAMKLAESEFSRAAMAKAKLLPCLSERMGAYVSVVGAYGRGTTGNLTHSTGFGRVSYTASTFAGYSGAAYAQGVALAGIHLHGGVFNGGYSSSYIVSMLQFFGREPGTVGEDTAEWLEDMKGHGAQVTYDASWRDVDNVRIRVAGRYHVVERGNVARVYGRTWMRDLEEGNYDHYYGDRENAKIETASGEAKAAHVLGDSVSMAKNDPWAAGLVAELSLVELKRLQQALTRRTKKLRPISPDSTSTFPQT